MCGIAGIYAFSGKTAKLDEIASNMAQTLRHRGPDDAGVWSATESGIALAHRRLSIMDLSEHGHQPMVSVSGRYVLCYNGEIYNFLNLRDSLDYPWQSTCDTEVLLAAVEAWGVEATLPKLNGMFAFALWDQKEKRLTLARDRIGEKPLYYGMINGTLLFASELKALKAYPHWQPTISNQALAHYLNKSYVPAPHTIFEGIEKLQPGHVIHFTPGHPKPTQQAYWSLNRLLDNRTNDELDESTCLEKLDGTLRLAVKQRMLADVPLGAFLSGGIDSSLIVSLMQAQSERPIKSFTIGFEEQGYNEAPYAKRTAEHIGTDHTELYVTAKDARGVIPILPELYDEPFADASQIPTFLIAKLTQQHVKVALSGDGGDEIFGGYNRHLYGPTLWKKLRLLPTPLRTQIAKAILSLPLPRMARQQTAEKLTKLLHAAQAPSQEAMYHSLCSIWHEPNRLLVDAPSPTPLTDPLLQAELPFSEWMMAYDTLTYLPDDILTKVDRAAMGVSLETRIPFLDPEVMKVAWQLPLDMKIRNGQGKWILQKLLHLYVPASLTQRPKSGFAPPIGDWLRGPLREWASDLLATDTLTQQGILNPVPIETALKQHLSGRANHTTQLWNLLMLQSWIRTAL